MDTTLVLKSLAELIQSATQKILEVNSQDVSAYQGGKNNDLSMLERLQLNESKIQSLLTAIQKVIDEPDPTNKILYEHKHTNGLKITNKTTPFGKILIIYESRPDVTIEASITAFKAGNQIFLKGGKEAHRTNQFLVDLWHQALTKNNQDPEKVVYLDLSREQTQNLIQENPYKIDLLIPRGGESLIKYVQENSKIPLLISGRGNNFMYIASSADLEMATKIALNGKQRLSVCNALDKILVNKNIKSYAKKLVDEFAKINVEVTHDPDLLSEEFLAPKIYIQEIDSLSDAIKIINQYSGGHSACIITANTDEAQKFQDQVDCAAVYHNASVRFTDGAEFGFGAEMAVGTSKLHARGPIGVQQLVTNKWYINGNGQIR